MPALLDHLVYGASDLETLVATFADEYGVEASAGGKHTGRGTHNALLGLGGSSYLELIAPDPEQPDPGIPRPFGLDQLVRPAVVGWAVAVSGIDAHVGRARAAGYDAGEPVAMERATPDGGVLRWRLTAYAGPAGGVIPFLIDWGDTAHPSVRAPGGLILVTMHVEHPDPDSVTAALRALDVAVEVRLAPAAAIVAELDGPRGRIELR